MKVLAVNGGPRKTWNTATLLEKALEGAASQGAETELVHLYDLRYTGCVSCFACKLKGGASYGRCAVQDDLKPLLAKVEGVDALILGSPNYLGMPTGMMKSFLERLIFPYLVYDADASSLFGRKIPTAFIYTMGLTEQWMKQRGHDQPVMLVEFVMRRMFGSSESLLAHDMYQFDDYSKYVATRFDAAAKAKRREEQFPVDCRKAFELGERLARQAGAQSR